MIVLTTEIHIKTSDCHYLCCQTLVHSMLAEQLNSSSWRHRVMTCNILPKLQGNINKVDYGVTHGSAVLRTMQIYWALVLVFSLLCTVSS